MSKFSQYSTVMKDGKCLEKVLNKHFKEVEVNKTPQQLFDYTGRKTTYLDPNGDKAEIIVRRKHVGGASNDMGFAKDSNGNFKAIISAYDRGKYGDKWLETVSKEYLIEKATEIMEEQEGEMYGAPETLSDGSIRLTFHVNA